MRLFLLSILGSIWFVAAHVKAGQQNDLLCGILAVYYLFTACVSHGEGCLA